MAVNCCQVRFQASVNAGLRAAAPSWEDKGSGRAGARRRAYQTPGAARGRPHAPSSHGALVPQRRPPTSWLPGAWPVRAAFCSVSSAVPARGSGRRAHTRAHAGPRARGASVCGFAHLVAHVVSGASLPGTCPSQSLRSESSVLLAPGGPTCPSVLLSACPHCVPLGAPGALCRVRDVRLLAGGGLPRDTHATASSVVTARPAGQLLGDEVDGGRADSD